MPSDLDQIIARGESEQMVESTRMVGLVSPEFETSPHSFTVRFRSQEYMPPTRVSHDLTPLQRQILAQLQRSGPLASSGLAKLMDPLLDSREVLRNLQALRTYGLVEMTGQKKGARWHLSSPDAP